MTPLDKFLDRELRQDFNIEVEAHSLMKRGMSASTWNTQGAANAYEGMLRQALSDARGERHKVIAALRGADENWPHTCLERPAGMAPFNPCQRCAWDKQVNKEFIE